MIKQIGLPLRGRPILLITRMITDRIGLHSVLLPLLIAMWCTILLAHINPQHVRTVGSAKSNLERILRKLATRKHCLQAAYF